MDGVWEDDCELNWGLPFRVATSGSKLRYSQDYFPRMYPLSLVLE